MKRTVFLQRLAGLVGLSLLAPPRRPATKLNPLMRFHIRGFQYYNGIKCLPKMRTGEPLQLVREPQNRYDNNAIALYYQGEKIGFVPAGRNEVICQLLDQQGLPLQARILALHREGRPWEAVEAGIGYESAA